MFLSSCILPPLLVIIRFPDNVTCLPLKLYSSGDGNGSVFEQK